MDTLKNAKLLGWKIWGPKQLFDDPFQALKGTIRGSTKDPSLKGNHKASIKDPSLRGDHKSSIKEASCPVVGVLKFEGFWGWRGFGLILEAFSGYWG